MLYVIATLIVKPGTRDATIAAAQPCVEATRKEPGCLRYDFNADAYDDTRLVFVEQWESREALSKHFEQPHLDEWREAREPYVIDARVEIVHAAEVETV